MHFVAMVCITATPVVLGEACTRILRLEREGARKLTHLLGGVATIVLGLLYHLRDIALVVGTFTLVMLIMRCFLRQHVRSLYTVERHSYGELFFPMGVALAAIIAPNTHRYLAAMIMLGFGDTAAALVGGRYPKGTYHILGHNKTVSGSLAFATTAVVGCLITGQTITASLAIVCAGTVAEAIGVYGSDNLLVPVIVVLV